MTRNSKKHKATTKQEIIKARKLKLFLISILMTVLTITGFSMCRSSDISTSGHGILVVAFSFPSLIVLMIAMFRRVIISPEGITVKSLLHTKHTKWDETGPFQCSEKNIYSGLYRNTLFFACAFPETTFRQMELREFYPAPSIDTADIIVALNAFPEGKNRATADAFVAKLNHYRNQFTQKNTDIPLDILSDDEFSQLITKLERKATKRNRLVFFSIVTVTILFLYKSDIAILFKTYLN